MTAEIAIMNKQGVALAADSAVTIGEGSKIFQSANKIFELSESQPVGIMIFGNAEFMSVPWETIISIFKRELKDKECDYLYEYEELFTAFIRSANKVFTEDGQNIFIQNYLGYFLYTIKNSIKKEIKKQINTKGRIYKKDALRIENDVVTSYYKKWASAKDKSNISASELSLFKKKYSKLINSLISTIFEKISRSKSIKRMLFDLSFMLFSKDQSDYIYPGSSGIVIAGYGKNDVFPSLRAFTLEGILMGELFKKEQQEFDISPLREALIMPFAQREMVFTFMEGVSEDYEVEIEKYIELICHGYCDLIIDSINELKPEEKEKNKLRLKELGKEFIKNCTGTLADYRKKHYSSPVTSTVSHLPKTELAVLAESLVNLTSLKKRVTNEKETVGGPIDVAIISKSDGFIWIRKKQYFRKEFN